MPFAYIDEQDNDIAFFDGQLRLGPNFSAEVSLAAQVQSSGIDYGKDASIPLSVGIDAVTSSSRQIFDYSQPARRPAY